MKKTLIISHFGLASGALSTLTYFGAHADVTAISAYENDVDPDAELEKFFAGCAPEDQVIIFTDIMGGSVNQKVMPYLATRENTYIIAGFNFPMLLQASALDENATIDDYRAVAEAGKEGIIVMNDYEVPAFDEDDE